MISRAVFVDTNIWVYATNPESQFFEFAQKKLNDLQDAENEIFISTQIIKEYTRVLTSEANFTYSEIRKKVNFLRTNFNLLDETADVMAIFEELIENHKVKGKPVYDCCIVASMIHNNIETLLTHNVTDFNPRYENQIKVIPML
jgi:predicted nucleic acid-binding protein